MDTDTTVAAMEEGSSAVEMAEEAAEEVVTAVGEVEVVGKMKSCGSDEEDELLLSVSLTDE